MICPHCGKEILDSAVFCSYCGKAQAEQRTDLPKAENNPPAEPTQPAAFPAKQKKKRNKKAWVYLCVCAVFALAGIVAVTIANYSYNKQIDSLSMDSFLENTTITREDYDVIDPTLVLRYGANKKLSTEALDNLRYKKDEEQNAEDGKTTYTYHGEDVVGTMRITVDASYNLLEATYECDEKFQSTGFYDLEKAIAKITGARLAWYATEEYSEQTHDSYLLHQYHCYICIPNRRIKLSIAEDGKYSVVYKLADDTFGNALNAAQIIYVNKLYDGGLKRLEDKYQEELLTVAMLSQISATNKIKLLETIHEASEVSKAALAEQKDKLIALAAEMSDMDIASEEFYQKNEAFLKELDKMEKLCGIA